MNKKKTPPPPTDPDVPCNCVEVFINDIRVPRPKWHDCAYIHRRNRRLGEVCLYADAAVGGMPEATELDRERRRNARAAVISREMDRIGFEIINQPLPTNADH